MRCRRTGRGEQRTGGLRFSIGDLLSLLAVSVVISCGLLITMGWRSAFADDGRNERLGLVHINSTEITEPPQGIEVRYQKALDAGAGWSRWPVYWDLIESAAGFDYSRADAVMAADVEHGFQVDAILLRTPSQYATGGLAGVPGPRVGQKRPVGKQLLGPSQLTSVPANLYAPVFDDGTDEPGPGKRINPSNYWARFVYKTVNRYKPGGVLAAQRGWAEGVGVRHWEIWNEPDWSFFWSGSVADYYRLLKVAYLAAKTADPEAVIILGGLMHFADPGWLPRLLDVMRDDPDQELRHEHNSFFDVIALHLYSDPRLLYDKTTWVKSLLANYGLSGKPIWVNETNVPIWDEYPGPTWDPYSPGRATIQEQADFIIEALAYAFAAGVERVFVFQLYDDCGNGPTSWDAYGLVRNNPWVEGSGVCAAHPLQPGVPRPAYTAYQVAASQFQELTPAWRRLADGVEQLAFTRPPGDQVRVVWNWQTVTRTVAITATTGNVTVINPLGASQSLIASEGIYTLTLAPATNTNAFGGPGTVMIGGRPLILVETTPITDTTPPISWIEPLPAESPPTFQVCWDGTDDLSGIAGYRVWWSDGPPSPTNDRRLWFAFTTENCATFVGEPGHTYYFGTLAYDRAGNRENTWAPKAWTRVVSPGVGQVSGRVADNRDRPVAGARVVLRDLSGGTWQGVSGEDGGYTVTGVPLGVDYSAQATADGLGAWSERWEIHPVFTGTSQIDFNLPPADNAVSNGGFEEGLAGWTLSGSTRAVVDSLAHSGTASLLLGDHFVGQPELGGGGNSTVSQVITVPVVFSPTLSLVYRRETEEVEPGLDWFEVLIIDGVERTDLLEREWGPSADWQFRWFDLSSWRGRTVILILNVWQSSGERATRVWVDEVAVGDAPGGPDRTIWPLFLPLLTFARAAP